MKSFFKYVLVILLFNPNILLGQDSFLKGLDISSTSRPSILPTSDRGWYVYLADETVLIRQNQCGETLWAKDLDIKNDNCCIGDPICSINDAVSILTRENDGLQTGFGVIQISSTGGVNWSKTFTKSGVDFIAYSISLGKDGNMWVYGFESPIGGGTSHLAIFKLDQSGGLIWSKRIDNSYVWGATSATSDSGALLRTGDQFIKLDVNGTIEWSVQIQSSGTYYYLAAVEVSDGYIFTKNNVGAGNVGFYKMDKSGNLLWTNAKYVNYLGNPLPLRSTGDNTFTTIFQEASALRTASIVVEFDKDLNVTRLNEIGFSIGDLGLVDYQMNANANPILVGFSSIGGYQLCVAKLLSNYTVGCDFTPTISFTDQSINRIPTTVTASNLSLQETAVSLGVIDITLSDTLLCSQTETRSLSLGSDTIICPNDSMVLQNLTSSLFDNYVWSTGAITPTISVSDSGKYWVEVSNACVNQVYSDTIYIGNHFLPQPVNFIYDSVLCGDQSLILDATVPNGSYLWHNGDTGAVFEVLQKGTYYVDVFSGICTERHQSEIEGCEEVNIPNVFTPNGDGVNDYFQVEYYGNRPFKLEIYNRWGNQIFGTQNPELSWEGRNPSGGLFPVGVYFYIVTIGADTYKGPITLLK